MKLEFLLLITLIGLVLSACGGSTANNQNISTANRPTLQASGSSESPMPEMTPVIPKDGDYKSRGKVTKINTEARSIELDHEDIPGVMPAMKMEFNVKDKAMLKDLKVGDQVNFTLQYKHPTETIVAISKAK